MSGTLVIGTAGHIDHGKSALVKALTGTDPDRLKEEQARGITIELGFAHRDIGGVRVSFIDVPGHERFVRTMLAGAGGFDAVLLVIAADESVRPQTREHFEICRLLGIERGVIVLTKSDLADADTMAVAAAEARDLVAGSFLEGATIVPVSARSGAGLDALSAAIAALAPAGARRRRGDAARLPIDRVFTVRGFGTVVTGTLVGGRIAEADALTVLPGGPELRVRGVQVHGGQVRVAEAPARAAVNLGAVEVRALSRGLTLASPGTLPVTRRIDVRVELINTAGPLKHGARLRVHQGTADVAARVTICAARPDRQSAWRPAAIGDVGVTVPPGGEAWVRLRLDAPIAVTRHDRIVLRTPSPPATIGGATVLDPLPPAAGMRRPGTASRFEDLDPGRIPGEAPAAELRALRLWILEAGDRGASVAELAARSGRDERAVREMCAPLVETGWAMEILGRLVASAVIDRIQAQVVEQVGARHRADALDGGLPREAARERIAATAAAGVFDAAIERLTRAGTIAGTDRLTLASQRPARSAAEARACEAVATLLKQSGLTPPDAAALSAAASLTPADVERVVRALVGEGLVVRAGGLVFHAAALARLKSEIKALAAPAGSGPARLDVGALKSRYGLSRKYAIPLLEWLDRERVTRRVGDVRIVL